MSDSYDFFDAQRLLIKPFERAWFIVIFVSATIICSEIGSYFWPQLICYAIGDLCYSPSTLLPGWPQDSIEYSIVTQMLTGTLTGITIGLIQWLILRRYLSTWKWILAVSMSFTLLSIHRAASTMLLSSYLSNDISRSGGVKAIVLPIIVAIVALIIAVFMVGYLQWYVLRPAVRQARWWILVPFIAEIVGIPVLLPSVVILISSRSSAPLPLFNSDFINSTLLPAVQAIGFCALNKKSVDDRPILQTPLAIAPDLTNYREIERIKKTLGTRISRIWKTGLDSADGKLTYLVGVDRSCTQIVYEPMDGNSLDNINLTPLPELVESSNYVAGIADFSTAFAKFQVVLAPPGTVEIGSWRGIPLKWFAFVYAIIIGMSALLSAIHAYQVLVINK
jgi:hypothetical protein